MSFGESFSKIRKEKGITRKDFAEKLGIPYTTLRNYEKDQREPGHKLLIKMATLLSVSVDDLIGHHAETKPAQLTPIEQEHIKKYRSLDSYGKEAVDGVLDVEWRRVEQAKEKAAVDTSSEITGTIIDLDKIIPFLRSLQPASAGTGIFLGPEEFETIYVQKNDLTRRASFGVPVSGDSMEPVYHNGDVLLLERAEDIRIGEVGVFTINGEGYVKERGDGELIPLNSAYDPISMNESIRCNGRVIGILDPDWIV